ncbi:unnamed protein product [Gongylonema pulchrum]|uniref:RUN domain-containing protein n=1 Tax=Gongylonema pulchrum TaxID=637853 RepID=A0A183EV37_9BILA|nr:unnamed protein product [Gongylonema pulchrum]
MYHLLNSLAIAAGEALVVSRYLCCMTFLELLDWLAQRAEQDALWNRFSARLLTGASIYGLPLESVLETILLSVKDVKKLQHLFGSQLHENHVVKYVFYDRSLFLKVYSPDIVKKLAQCLQISNNDKNGLFYNPIFASLPGFCF